MPLKFPWAALMRRMGEAATYTPVGGDPLSVFVKRIGGGREVSLGDVRLVVEDLAAHVLRSAVPNPAAGDLLAVGGNTWTVGAVEPLADDPQATRWALRLTWGLPLTIRTPGSGDAAPDPVGDAVTLTARAAAAGAGMVTLEVSGWTAGRIRGGDLLTIGGADHTATADVALSLNGQSWTFPAVPIAPVLAAPVAGGLPVIVTPPTGGTARTVYGAPAEWTQEEIVGGIATSDQRFVIRATPGAVPPTTSDLVRIGIETRDRQITGVRTITGGAEVVAWAITVQS